MSHNFLRDKDYLRSFLGIAGRLHRDARPERPAGSLLDELRREGFEPRQEDMRVVHSPAGLDLGGEGPEEIAWAIVGEILALRNGRAPASCATGQGPIHDRPHAPRKRPRR